MVPAAMCRGMASTSISRQSVFCLSFVGLWPYVASPIPRLVCLEMVEARRPAFRKRSNVTMMRIKAIIDMAVKAVRSVEPWARANKYPAGKPIGPIVAVRSAVIRSIVEIPIRTHGGWSHVYADGNLGLCTRCAAQKESGESCESKDVGFEHNSP